MHILFPSEPFNKKAADEPYAIEYEAFHSAGLKCALFSPLDFDQGAFKPWPPLPLGDMVLYRGWMLKPEEYQRLYAAILLNGNVPLTNPDQYRACHYLPEWYSLFHEYTPETVFASRDADFASSQGTWRHRVPISSRGAERVARCRRKLLMMGG